MPRKYSERSGAYAVFSFRELPRAPGVAIYVGRVRQPKVLTLYFQGISGFFGGGYAIFRFRGLPLAPAGYPESGQATGLV